MNLELDKIAFETKMLKEPKGLQLLQLLESGEWRICERLGLIKGYIKGGRVYFSVPSWFQLVKHLIMVNG